MREGEWRGRREKRERWRGRSEGEQRGRREDGEIYQTCANLSSGSLEVYLDHDCQDLSLPAISSTLIRLPLDDCRGLAGREQSRQRHSCQTFQL